jgi:putative DNA primase/helicase
MTTAIQASYSSLVDEVLPGARLIKLKGFSRNNIDYQKAKTPVGKWQDSNPIEDNEINQWIKRDGWIGAVIPQERIIVDIDDSIQGEAVKGLLEAENVHHHCIKTPNGWQFIFEAKEEVTKEIKQITKFFTQIGAVVDTRTAEAGYIVFPTDNTESRYIVSKSLNKLDELPHYLKPVRSRESTKNKETQEYYEFPIPIRESGSRNDTLYKFAAHLKAWNVDPKEIIKSMELIYEHFLLDKTDFPLNELKNLSKSAVQWKPEPSKTTNFQLYLEEDGELTEETIIPMPFNIVGNALFKTVVRKVEGFEVEQQVMVSRMAPTILKELSNVERNSVHYEIAWKDRGREKREVVPASTIATKKDLLTLADSGFPCNDLNYKDLINYFDKYLAHNRLEQSQMVERLGHIKNAFIHPLDSQGVEIVPNDNGEKQILEAFQIAGTADTWKTEVFERIKNHPKVLFLVLSSLASVLLNDIKVSPFIVDLSGSTSQGKTTALQVARSVWGTEGLLNEWNATRVAIERKAGFLNSFPLYMDDTRKADERILQSIVYQFSGGRSKGRGSLKGSQREATWNNILISTGEVSLADYAAKAGGAAARVISLVDEPFETIKDIYFSELYEAIEKNYGAFGLEFLKQWNQHKEELIPEFYKFKEHYMKKAKGNEVVTRLSMYYAAVHFAGSVARKVLNLEMDLKLLDMLFDEMTEGNKAIDKPKQILEELLLQLDSGRKYIYNEYVSNEVRAVYKFDTICITPAYLKEFLGNEEKLIRKEWMKRGYTETCVSQGKEVDYKQVKKGFTKFRVVVVKKDFIDEMGLDFKEDVR